MAASNFFLPIQHHGHITSLTMSTFTNGLPVSVMLVQMMVYLCLHLICCAGARSLVEATKLHQILFHLRSRRRPLLKCMGGYSVLPLLRLRSLERGDYAFVNKRTEGTSCEKRFLTVNNILQVGECLWHTFSSSMATNMEVDTPAVTGVMAAAGTSGSVTVSLHPLVIMNVSEHWTRVRAQEGKPVQGWFFTSPLNL